MEDNQIKIPMLLDLTFAASFLHVNLTNAKPLGSLPKYYTKMRIIYNDLFIIKKSLRRVRTYPVSKFLGIKTSQTNPTAEKTTLISLGLACKIQKNP